MPGAAVATTSRAPLCTRRFDTYPHYGPGNVVIDSCTHCDMIWLDFGEIRQIVDAPGSDRGSRQLPRIDDSYIRKGPPAVTEDRPRADDPLKLLFDLFND